MATYQFKVHKDSVDGEEFIFNADIIDPYDDTGSVHKVSLSKMQNFLTENSSKFTFGGTVFSYSDDETQFFVDNGFYNIIQLPYVDTSTLTVFYVDGTDYQIKVKSAYTQVNWGLHNVYISKNNIDKGIQFVGIPAYTPSRKGTFTMNASKIYAYTNITNPYGCQFATYQEVDEATTAGYWNDLYYNVLPPYEGEDTDPYRDGGNSGTGGGTGTFSGTGDSIEFPGLPTLSAVSTGFITLFNPSIAQMQSLANYMWSDLFDLDTFKKIFADPMDCILGLSIVPVAVPNGGTAEVKVGNISTGVSMTVASSQYVEVDCGTLNVQEYWGSYLDYDPYTKAEIYLPYCGTHPIATDDIMGKSVHVKYHVDILSGACVAYVKCGSSVLYSFIGQCTSSIPITGNDWTNVVNGAISIASAIGSMVATGGATAPLVLPGVASTAVNNLKPSVEKSGSMSGTGGMLAVQTPYLILTRPRQALPKKQNTYTGYPSFIKENLSDLKGYTEVAEIRLSGVDATDAELDEIVGLLKGGVII